MKVDVDKLTIVHYPDPRLRQRCAEVTVFDGELAELAERMFELMRDDRGVGLAAAQVGVSTRLFVMNLTGEDADRQVFVNPVLRDREGNVEAEEGCLSLPGINVNVKRARRCRIEAQDLEGRPFEMTGEELVARCWQHEVDHLDGVLIIDRMGPADRIATKKPLKELAQKFNGRKR